LAALAGADFAGPRIEREAEASASEPPQARPTGRGEAAREGRPPRRRRRPEGAKPQLAIAKRKLRDSERIGEPERARRETRLRARPAALMRSVGGRLRGRALAAPPSAAIRPTADRLRETLFNVLVHAYGDPVTGARVLDLFAGTGALGLEALSRGAAFALFVD